MQYLIAIILGLTLLFATFGFMNHAAAERVRAEAQAEAIIIRAQSQARLDAATASAITTTALLPMAIVVGGTLVGLVFAVAALLFALRYRPARPEVRVIERQVIMMLPAAGSRREVWNALAKPQGSGIIIHQEGGK